MTDLLHHLQIGIAPREPVKYYGEFWMPVLQIKDYRLTTAEILYHLPDHPALLQSYLWQNMDLVPNYPELHRFLDFWNANIEGKLHSIRVASGPSIKPAKVRHAVTLRYLH